MRYSVLSKYRSELMGMAMLWVMVFHAWNLDTGIPLLQYIRALGFGGVDIFIVLSAMGLVMSLNRRDQEYGAFMVRRAGRILPAYFVVMIPYTLFCIYRGTADLASLIWNASLLNYWVRPRGSFNWYVCGIMLFYAITPFCFHKLKKARHKTLWTAVAAAGGLLISRILIDCNYWGHLDVPYRIPVFFLGLLMGFYVVEDRAVGWKDVLFWCVSLAAGLAYGVSCSRLSELWRFLPLCHMFLLTTVPVCLTACLCFEKLSLGWLRKVLRLVGENSLEIYLLNVSFFSELELLQGLCGFGPSNRLYFLLAIPVNVLLGVVLHRAVAAGQKALAARKAA